MSCQSIASKHNGEKFAVRYVKNLEVWKRFVNFADVIPIDGIIRHIKKVNFTYLNDVNLDTLQLLVWDMGDAPSWLMPYIHTSTYQVGLNLFLSTNKGSPSPTSR